MPLPPTESLDLGPRTRTLHNVDHEAPRHSAAFRVKEDVMHDDATDDKTRKDEPVRESDWFSETRVWIEASGD